MLKFVFLVLCIVAARGVEHDENDLKCNFRKIELAQFCVRNCTPPVVHEFFQSIIFAITRRIPGNCQREECAEKNRFVALAKCSHEKAWPLLQCSKRLVDLAQVALEVEQHQQKRNYTCSIVVETTQCIEEILHECGTQPFSLVKEIFGDVIKLGISAYCHRSFRNDFFVEDPSTPTPDYQERMKHFTDMSPLPGRHPYPQFVKGYNPGSASTSKVSFLCILSSLALSSAFLFRRW